MHICNANNHCVFILDEIRDMHGGLDVDELKRMRTHYEPVGYTSAPVGGMWGSTGTARWGTPSPTHHINQSPGMYIKIDISDR